MRANQIDDLPMPDSEGASSVVVLDAWELRELRQRIAADALVFVSHYTMGTAGRFSDDEIATMQRLRRLSAKLAIKSVDPLREFVRENADTLKDAVTHRKAWLDLLDDAESWGGIDLEDSEAYRSKCKHEANALVRLLKAVTGIVERA